MNVNKNETYQINLILLKGLLGSYLGSIAQRKKHQTAKTSQIYQQNSIVCSNIYFLSCFLFSVNTV